MPITLNTVVYSFRGISQPGNLSVYSNQDAGMPSGFSMLTAAVNGLNPGAKGSIRTSWKLKLPVVADTATACACPGDVLDEYIVDVIVTAPRKSVAAQRTEIRKRIQSLVLAPEFVASIEGFVQPSA